MLNEGPDGGEFRLSFIQAGDNSSKCYIPVSQIEPEMEKMVTFINQELNYCYDRQEANSKGDHYIAPSISVCKGNPIVLAGKVMSKLVSIHPFPDANGRTGRFLMNAILQKFNILPVK